MKLKTKFSSKSNSFEITIVGGHPDGKPYLRISNYITTDPIDDPKQIELLAVNILKKLNSDKLKK